MRFSAGITLYNPNERQIKRVFELADCFDRVYLFDNTDNTDISHLFDADTRICYFSERRNTGLSHAFNFIFQKALENKEDFVCTLDQDSLFEANDIVRIKTKIQKDIDVNVVGIVAPFIDYGSNHYKLFEKTVEKKWVITSGSFVNMILVKRYNVLYDENYFIDKFEIDFCENIIRHGFKVLMYLGSVLHQELGEKGKYKGHPNHNEIRHYYLFRNRFYFNKKWFGFLKRGLLNFLQTGKHILQILLFEDNKMSKLKMLPIAKADFKKRNMGKISLNGNNKW